MTIALDSTAANGRRPHPGTARLARYAALACVAAGLAAGFLARRVTVTEPATGIAHHHAALHAAMAAQGDGAAARPVTRITPIACEKLPNVPGKSLTTAKVEFPPNAFTPRHRHPGSSMAFILKGTIRSQLAGQPVETLSAGQSLFEPPGTIHLFAENPSTTEPAELLAIFVADDDCGPLTILEPQ